MNTGTPDEAGGRVCADRADVVIVGAGCAGLSLAARLAEPDAARVLAGRRVVVVDARTSFGRDRTWCFWDTDAHPFGGAVTRRWARWRVAARGAAVERGSRRYTYQHVPGDAFYAEALARVRRAPHVELRLGTPVRAVADEGDAVRVDTAAGAIRAACVFDSRPPARWDAAPGPGRLVQAFAGAVVRTAAPAFDPAVATLMDFAAPWDGPGLGFGYVLPYAPDAALVEVAVLAAEAPAPDALAAAAARYARRVARGRAHEVVLREAGVIPMDGTPAVRRPSPRVVRIGLAGGLARPSTGYAFLAIQRDAARAAAALVESLAPTPGTADGAPGGTRLDAALAACAGPPRGAVAAWLDRVFLRRLAADPSAADVFTRLFARTDPDALVRFLSDAATPWDVARVVGALPPVPYAVEAARMALEPRQGRGRPPVRGTTTPAPPLRDAGCAPALRHPIA